jgi:hypothetical protein
MTGGLAAEHQDEEPTKEKAPEVEASAPLS